MGRAKFPLNGCDLVINAASLLMQSIKCQAEYSLAATFQILLLQYLNPPEKVLVLCVDEKSQIQALDGTPGTLD